MIRRRLLIFAILAGLLTVASAQPLVDRVRLRSGETVNGSFVSADAVIVRILLANGKIAEYAVADVSAVEFSPRNNARSGAAAASPAQPITVPAGTVLSVTLSQSIDVDVIQPGTNIRALVDTPVMIGEKVVIPRNAAVVVQAAKTKDAATVRLNAHTLSFAGHKYTLATAFVEHKGLVEKEKPTTVPAETRLQFPLTSALILQP